MSNFDLITAEILRGKPTSGVEDFAEMYRRSSTINAWWKDKRVDMTMIKCPTYIRGSDVSNLHNMGSIRAWLEIPHDKKWIQWGAYQEWYELYSIPESAEQLTTFFDFYLRGINNGWEKNTPKVRWTTLKFGDGEPIHDIELLDWPVPNTQYLELFASENSKLSKVPPSTPTSVTYNSEDRGSWVEFTHTFSEPSRLIGLPKATIYASCDTRDDFVIFVILRKKDKNGKDMLHLNFPFHASPVNSIADIDENEMHSVNTHEGQMGILRASHREIDHSKSIHPNFPFHPHEREQKVAPGTVVKLEIGVFSMGVDFDAGESISFRVSLTFELLAVFTL